jgi:hypothetical protein
MNGMQVWLRLWAAILTVIFVAVALNMILKAITSILPIVIILGVIFMLVGGGIQKKRRW